MRLPLVAARRTAAALLLCGGALALAAPLARAQGRTVLVATVRDTITPVIADHLREGIRQAARDRHVAFVVRLDTPGGLDTAMREIIQAIIGAPLPVVVHVAPPGGRAASAGALITMAAHVAAMAPGTNIGAATPVDLQGGDISQKVINDAAAYAVSIARLRGRSTGFAEDAVRKGLSVEAEEAVRLDVVDLLAPTLAALLDEIDGRTVRLASGSEVTLRTAGAEVVRYELRGFRRVLQWLADPNLAFIFLSIGTLAILYELANPGIGAGGVTGALFIILALFSLSVLPVNAVGAILIALAASLFFAEIFTPGLGALAGGGAVALLVGGMFLFRGSVTVDLFVLVPVAAVVFGTALVIGRFAFRTRRLPAMTGTGSVVGQRGVVRSAAADAAQVLVDGVWWRARSAGSQLAAGQRVRVVSMEGLELVVEPEEEGTS